MLAAVLWLPAAGAAGADRLGCWRLAMDVGAARAESSPGRIVAVWLPDGIEGVELGSLMDVSRERGELADAAVLEDSRGQRLVFRAPSGGRYVARFGGRPTAGAPGGAKPDGSQDTKGLPQELTLSVSGLPSGHPPATPEEARRLARSARPLYGEEAMGQVRLREHPFGLNGRYVARFSGALRIGQAGPWRFRVQSFGPCFLFVDGRELLAGPRDNRRSWSLRIEQSEAACTLSAGVHTIECLYFNVSGPPYLDLLASPPAGEGFGPAAESMWVRYEEPEALSLCAPDGKPVPFLRARQARPSVSFNGEVRTQVTLAPCYAPGEQASYRVTLEGKAESAGPDALVAWLRPGFHTARVEALRGGEAVPRAVQRVRVTPSAFAEALDVRLDLACFPAFSYGGNRQLFHIAVRTSNSIPHRVEYAVREEGEQRPVVEGSVVPTAQHGATIVWPAVVPEEGGKPRRAAVELRVWGREVGRAELLLLPLGAPGKLDVVASGGSFRGPRGEAIALTKSWQSGEPDIEWAIPRYVAHRLRSSPAPRSVVVVGLPGGEPEWDGLDAALKSAFGPRGAACEVIPFPAAPWPCLHDVAALRKRLAAAPPDAAVVSLGWWDAAVGTPVDTFAQAVDFAIALARGSCGRVVVVLPGRRGEGDGRLPYTEAAREVAKRHRVPFLELQETPEAGDGGRGGAQAERRWPSPSAQQELARRAAELVFKR